MKKNTDEQRENRMSKDIRTYVASAVFVILLILLLGYLTFIPVPDANKDLIVAIIGVLVGGASSAMTNLFGKGDEEKEKLLNRVRKLENEYTILQTEYGTLKNEYDKIMGMLVTRHVVEKEGIQ